MAFLELNSVYKGFSTQGNFRSVLADLNCHISQGEFLVFLGYSGTGKSTLMSLLAGLHSPDQGSILLRDNPLNGPSPERALVFQNYSLLPWLTVYDNIALAVHQNIPAMVPFKNQGSYSSIHINGKTGSCRL